MLLPGKTFTATISGPAHNYSFRQTGGKGFPGKIEVDFTGHVSLSPSSSAVNFGRTVRLKGTTNLHSTPVVLQVHRSGDSHWTTLATVFSSGSGAYAATVRLLRGGKLRATVAAGQIRSAVKLVDVRPKLTRVPARRRRDGEAQSRGRGLAADARVPDRPGPLEADRLQAAERRRRRLLRGAVRPRARSRRGNAQRREGRLRPAGEPGAQRGLLSSSERSRLVPRIDGSGSRPSSSSTVGATSSRLIALRLTGLDPRARP